MSTITICGLTPSQVGDVVEALLNHLPDLSISIDNDYDDPTLAARAATETGHHAVIDTILAAEKAKADRYERYSGDYDQMLTVVCPKCSSQPTQPCAKPSGSYHARPYVHQARRLAWRGVIPAPEPWVGRHLAVAAPAATEVAYCMCGHLDEVHHHDGSDHSCVIDGCSCPVFEAVTPIFRPITLDEM